MVNFFIGILFLTVILPVCEQIGSILCMIFELGKAKLSLLITKVNTEIQENQQPNTESRAIGFTIEEDYEDDEVL